MRGRRDCDQLDAQTSIMMTPDAARLASDLSRHMRSHFSSPAAAAPVPGRPPLKLLKWALAELEECARSRTMPASDVVQVAMDAIKDEMRAPPAGEQQPQRPGPPADRAEPCGGGGGDGAGGEASKAGRARVGNEKRAAGSSSRGGGRKKNKGVVFTPLYGCDEEATGVGPVSSILEVSGTRAVCFMCRFFFNFKKRTSGRHLYPFRHDHSIDLSTAPLRVVPARG